MPLLVGCGGDVGSAKLANPQLLLSHICEKKHEGNTGQASGLAGRVPREMPARLH